jgi:hypothetical protein
VLHGYESKETSLKDSLRNSPKNSPKDSPKDSLKNSLKGNQATCVHVASNASQTEVIPSGVLSFDDVLFQEGGIRLSSDQKELVIDKPGVYRAKVVLFAKDKGTLYVRVNGNPQPGLRTETRAARYAECGDTQPNRAQRRTARQRNPSASN